MNGHLIQSKILQHQLHLFNQVANMNKLILILCLAFFSKNSYALGPLHLDLHASAGYGKAAAESESESPTTTQYNVGTTLGWKFLAMYGGVSADYYMVNQLTKPNNTFGNRKGKRTNLLSPTIGFRLANLHLKLDYQLMGKYDLDKTTTGGEKVTYESPKGMRAYLGFRYSPMMELGGFYETVTYKEEKIGSTTTELTNKMKITQFGLAWTIVL